jgi:NDP-sugar pyrophosphorylase family protein/aminoglycoside/choline kinase family phosphotransferase
MTDSRKCFVLAAGLGERMRPMTSHIPKPLLPIAGKPLLECVIEKALAAGFRRIGVNTHHLAPLVEEWVEISGFKENISLFHEPLILNTGGALKNAVSFLAGSDFLVHNGDILSDIDLAELFECHRRSGNIATLAIFDCPGINNVLIGDNGLFAGVGKTVRAKEGERLAAFTGIAVYSPSFLRLLPDGASSVLSAWTKAVEEGLRIGVFDTSGHRWSDIGSPAAYVSAVIDTLRDEGETVYSAPSANIGSDIELNGAVIIEQSSIVGRGANLKNCIILPRGVVASGASYENSIIGPDYAVRVEESAFGVNIEGKGVLIGSGGSSRKYYRVGIGSHTRIVMECGPDDPDFERHIQYTNFLGQYGFPVPEIISPDMQKRTAAFEDLGDMSLYSWRKIPRTDEEIEIVYRRIMEIIALLHGSVSDHVAECPALAARIFDYDYLRWETSYFLEKFVKGICKRNIENPSAFNDEFHRLALKTDSFTKRIIHRDFQSQNIMITKGGVPRVIDFQGARMAPPAYDIASVLWDPYAPLKTGTKAALTAFYTALLTAAEGAWFSPHEFSESLIYCRLQRHMQALGAYGCLSGERGKPYFLKHVPEALRLLKEEAILTQSEFPALAELVTSL